MNQLSLLLTSRSFCVLIVFFCSFQFASAQCNVICSSAPNDGDFDALKELYCDTDGDNWKNNDGWYESLHEGAGCNYCEWYGVTCEDGRVVELDLFFNDLAGPIPSQISKLKKLRVLQLGSNDITGSLPGSIGQLVELEELRLSGNEFHSPLPPQIGQLVNLKVLYLDYAPFTGDIPEEIGDLVNLEELNLIDNFFTSYPQSLGNLTKLKSLQLWDSFDDGLPFPNFLDQLTQLENLRIAGDAMTGTFPEELLDLPNLKSIILDRNQLSGMLPEGVVNWDSLQYFIINNNNFDGEFAMDFSQCEKLLNVNISYNIFSGLFPEGFGAIESLNSLNARNNDFEGCFPMDLYGKCDQNVVFYQNYGMSFNGYFDQYCETDGAMDAQVGSKCDDGMGSVELDYIDANCECNGCEHPDAAALLKLYYSSSFNWNKTGTNDDPQSETEGWGKDCNVCDWYGVACNFDGRVNSIFLPSNGLSHSISDQFENLPFLEFLDLSNNSIRDELPLLNGMDSLRYLNLSHNEFYRTIPKEWASKTNLENLALAYNELNGNIPAEFDTLSKLKFVDFSQNQLNGEIPFSAARHPDLERLDLADNSFDGPLPIGIGEETSLFSLDLRNNLFEGCIPESYRHLCDDGILKLSGNNLLPWQGDEESFCMSEDQGAQNGAHCGFNGGGYFSDCDCINGTMGCGSAEEILCKPWVQEFAQTIPCFGQNRYSIHTSMYGNIPVIMFSRGTQVATKSISTKYIFTCDGVLLENCSFSLGSNCDYEQSIYKSIIDDLVQIFHCAEDVFPSDCGQACLHPDYPALISIYGATEGDSWVDNTGWQSGADGDQCDPCDGWYGVECDGGGRVIGLDLNQNNLSGNIPTALSNIRYLEELNLGGNGLSGRMPISLTRLDYLARLNLSNNNLTGEILPALHEMTRISQINLNDNQLVGAVPEFDVLAPYMYSYKANGNMLTALPSSFALATELEDIDLSDNQLSGDLDEEIFELEYLSFLNLSNNNLTGGLPQYIANSSGINYINISNNQLTGEVPESFGGLEQLVAIDIHNNDLGGLLPESMGMSTSVIDFNVSNNQFSGPLPTFIQNFTTAYNIDLSGNAFEGCIDSSFLEYCDVLDLDFSNNPLLENDDWATFCADKDGLCVSDPTDEGVYHPMAIEYANWLFEIEDTDAPYTTYYGWRIEGDTMIHNTMYKKGFRIDAQLVVAPPYQHLEFSIDKDSPAFFMRDDMLEKKVYVLYDFEAMEYNCASIVPDEEVLVYDFAPMVDEEIYCEGGQQMVSEIDTVEYFDYILPRYSINNGNRIQYQQIGDPEGLFFDINLVFVDTYSERLIEYCVREDLGCFHLFDPLSVDRIGEDEDVRLYPNPARDKITISSMERIRSIDIYSMDGRRLRSEKEINHKEVSLNVHAINGQVLVALILLEDGRRIRKVFSKN